MARRRASALTEGPSPEKKKARYNLVLPEEDLRELQDIADRKGITLVELLRKGIRLLKLYVEIESSDNPDDSLIIRKGGKEREIIIF